MVMSNQDGEDPAQAPYKSMGNCTSVKAAGHRGRKDIPRAPSIPRSTIPGSVSTRTGRDYTRVASFSASQYQSKTQIAPAKTKNSTSEHHAETEFPPTTSKVAASVRGRSTSTGPDYRRFESFSGSENQAETQILPAKTKNSASDDHAETQIGPANLEVSAFARGESSSTGPDYRRVASFSGSQHHGETHIPPAKTKYSPMGTRTHDAGEPDRVSLSTVRTNFSSRMSLLHKDLPKPKESRETSSTVCTPDQKPRVEQGIISSTLSRRLSDSKGFAQSSNELCKDCRASNLESICYISNDGRIAAAKLIGPSVCHVHQCKIPRCAASKSSASHRPSPLSKVAKPSNCTKDCLDVERSSNPLIDEVAMFHYQVQSIGDGEGNCAGTCDNPENHWPAEQSSRDADRQSTDGTSTADRADSPRRDNLLSDHCQSGCIVPCSHENCVSGNDQNHNINCRANDGEDQQTTGCSTPINGQSECLLYHADNELSCSEDGTDTPFSTSKSAFIDLLIGAIDKSPTGEHLTRSRIARMRRKYLDKLKEQEAETVRLRKQEIQARKNVGDWMIDCAMEELLHRLAPTGEARVKVLVEAFETIIHHSDSDHSQHVDQEPEHQNKAVPMPC